MLKIHPLNPLSGSACENSKQRLRIYPEGFRQLADGTEMGFYWLRSIRIIVLTPTPDFSARSCWVKSSRVRASFSLLPMCTTTVMVPQTAFCHHPTEMVSKKCVNGS